MNPPDPTHSLAAQRAAEEIGKQCFGTAWSEWHKHKSAQIIERETRVGEMQAENAKLRKALGEVTGQEAEWVAHDLDHGNFRRCKWWKAVKRARALLARLPAPPPTE